MSKKKKKLSKKAQDLNDKIEKNNLRFICFNGKKAAKEFYGVSNVEYGLQEKKVNETRIFIAPSTSGAANGFWDIDYWYNLSKLIIQ